MENFEERIEDKEPYDDIEFYYKKDQIYLFTENAEEQISFITNCDYNLKIESNILGLFFKKFNNIRDEKSTRDALEISKKTIDQIVRILVDQKKDRTLINFVEKGYPEMNLLRDGKDYFQFGAHLDDDSVKPMINYYERVFDVEKKALNVDHYKKIANQK